MVCVIIWVTGHPYYCEENELARYRQIDREKSVSETRQHLLLAAMEEFGQKGYASANINRISEAAGLAKGTVYNYFPSKQALLLTLINEIGADHLSYITGQVLGETDAIRRLECFYTAGFNYVEKEPLQARFLITTLNSAEEEFKLAMFRAYQSMFQLVSDEILAVGVSQGCFQVTDVRRTAALLMTIYLGTSSQLDQNGRPWLDPIEVARFVLQALKKDS